MTYNSPLSVLSTGITFFVQTACGCLLTQALCALLRSHRVRLYLWTCFLLLTIAGWVFLFIPAPVRSPVEVPVLATQASPSPHWAWPLSDAWISPIDKLESWALPTYLLVLAIFLVQLLVKRLRLELLLRSRQDPGPELLLLFGRLCQEMKLRHCQLSLLEQLRSPATVCWFRSHVLLPTELPPRLDGEQLAQILRHELIHVKRRDYLWDRLAALGCRILFFHPAVWFAYRHIRRERELACDQAVAGNNWDSRLPYAECLTTLARWWVISEASWPKGIGFSSSSSFMATRIRELLREPRRASILERAFRIGLVTVTLVVGVFFLPGIALTLYRSDSQFRASRLVSPSVISKSRTRTDRKSSQAQTHKPAPTEFPHPPYGPPAQDQVLSMLVNSGAVRLPLLLPDSTAVDGIERSGPALSDRRHREYSDSRTVPWDESSAPMSGSASTTLRNAAIDAIRIGVETLGRQGSDGESGGEQGNHQR
jgi:beta-lactamase regulating signal transducer with metallopeptidase domain